jgi:hypothetical protein
VGLHIGRRQAQPLHFLDRDIVRCGQVPDGGGEFLRASRALVPCWVRVASAPATCSKLILLAEAIGQDRGQGARELLHGHLAFAGCGLHAVHDPDGVGGLQVVGRHDDWSWRW